MGEGDDVVHANAGITIVYGENGNDRVDMNGGSGSFHGGDGNDIANVFGGTGFGFNGGAGEDRLDIYAAGVPAHFAGGEGNDTLLGTAATLNGQTFSDFARGDRIVLTDAQPQSFQFHMKWVHRGRALLFFTLLGATTFLGLLVVAMIVG